MNVLFKLISKLWNIKDDKVVSPSIILPHGYDITKDEKLPESAKRVLDKAVEMTKDDSLVKWVVFNSDYFPPSKEFAGKDEKELKAHSIEREGKLKDDYIKTLFPNLNLNRVDMQRKGIHSTIGEIELTIEYLQKNFSFPHIVEVVSICDRPHARRVRYIWKKLTSHLDYTGWRYKVVSVDGVWDKSMPSKWQQSDMKWLASNIIGLCAYKILGLKRAGKVKHKVQ